MFGKIKAVTADLKKVYNALDKEEGYFYLEEAEAKWGKIPCHIQELEHKRNSYLVFTNIQKH